MKVKEIDPVVYGWCRDHGLSVLEPEAESEFSIWCAEIDAMKEIDVNDEGEYELVYGYDLAEEHWLRDVELENEILREEFYDSYAEFLEDPHIEWQERKTKMKINYGIHELHKIHEEIIDIVNNTDPLTIEWIACSTFLAEVYELEVTKHGGLDAEKIKEYKAVCREFFKCENETL